MDSSYRQAERKTNDDTTNQYIINNSTGSTELLKYIEKKDVPMIALKYPYDCLLGDMCRKKIIYSYGQVNLNVLVISNTCTY